MSSQDCLNCACADDRSSATRKTTSFAAGLSSSPGVKAGKKRHRCPVTPTQHDLVSSVLDLPSTRTLEEDDIEDDIEDEETAKPRSMQIDDDIDFQLSARDNFSPSRIVQTIACASPAEYCRYDWNRFSEFRIPAFDVQKIEEARQSQPVFRNKTDITKRTLDDCSRQNPPVAVMMCTEDDEHEARKRRRRHRHQSAMDSHDFRVILEQLQTNTP